MHCWRHKTPVIYRATAQWFVGMDRKPSQGPTLRERALKGVEATLLPGLGPVAIAFDDRQPSRLVHFSSATGACRFPSCFTKETGELHPRTVELMEAVAKRVEEGIEAWFRLSTQPSSSARGRRLRQDQRHPGRVVRLIPAPPTGMCYAGSHPDGHAEGPPPTFTSRAPTSMRLVPFLVADRLRDRRTSTYKALLTHGFTVDERAGR